MKRTLALVVGLGLCASSAYAASPDCEQLKGEWVNELGSTLTINKVDSSNGGIAGTYQSPSGTQGKKHALVGWTNTAKSQPNKSNVAVVSFSVNWGKFGSVTSWSGTCSVKSGVPTIKTVWNLVRSNSDFEWDHILTNSDTFTPK